MSKKVLIAISDGTEETEAVTPIDLFRRAGFEVTVAGDKDIVTCSRGVKIVADVLIDDIFEDEEFDLLVLPGGGIGTENLMNNKRLEKILRHNNSKSKLIGAICAAPTILTAHHLIPAGSSITSFPDMKYEFENYNYLDESVVQHKNFVTSRGVGTAIDFSLSLISLLAGKETAIKVANSIVYNYE